MIYELPKHVLKAMEIIKLNNGKAYVVGGSVRDMIMGIKPHDYDITTNLVPTKVMEIFKDFKQIEKNGLKHGTVTVRIDNNNIEITTYREDGVYKDGRHPLDIKFSNDLKSDLSRRDFTINAIAYDGKEIVDIFGGIDDIKNKIIKTVGDPLDRFEEDYLRILRALRFKSRLGFEIEKNTKDAILKLYKGLNFISKERIKTELEGILDGDYVYDVLMEFSDLFAYIMPPLKPAIGFNQYSKYHKNDVYTHSALVTSYVKKGFVSKMAALFHDIGKPDAFTLDSDGIGHFRGHQKFSLAHVKTVLNDLKCSNAEKTKIEFLVLHHDDLIEKTIKSVANMLINVPGNSKELFMDMMDLKKADSMDHLITLPYTDADILDFEALCDKVFEEKIPLSIKDLKIDGSDLIELGYSGEKIGDALEHLFELVRDDNHLNQRETLLKFAKDIERIY